MKLLKKGDEMTSLLLIFVACIVTMFAAVWVYNKNEDTAFHETKRTIDDLRTKLKEQETLLQSNIGTVASANLRVQAAESKVAEFEKQVEAVQDHCAKLRECQIALQDALSKKRPVFKPSGPIQVEIFTSDKAPKSPHGKKPLGKGIKSLLKETQTRGN